MFLYSSLFKTDLNFISDDAGLFDDAALRAVVLGLAHHACWAYIEVMPSLAHHACWAYITSN